MSNRVSVGSEVLGEVYFPGVHTLTTLFDTLQEVGVNSGPIHDHHRGPEMSLTARVLDASVRLRTGQLAAASRCFSCHMRNTDQAAGWCEGHFGVGEADVSLDTTPLERSPRVANRGSGRQRKTLLNSAAAATRRDEGNLKN